MLCRRGAIPCLRFTVLCRCTSPPGLAVTALVGAVLCRCRTTLGFALPLLSHAIQSLAVAQHRLALPQQFNPLLCQRAPLPCSAAAVRGCSKPSRCESHQCYAPASPFPALLSPCVASLDPAMPQLCRSTQCSSIATHFPSEHSCAAASRYLESALPLQVLAVLCPCRADLFVALLCRCVS